MMKSLEEIRSMINTLAWVRRSVVLCVCDITVTRLNADRKSLWAAEDTFVQDSQEVSGNEGGGW